MKKNWKVVFESKHFHDYNEFLNCEECVKAWKKAFGKDIL